MQLKVSWCHITLTDTFNVLLLWPSSFVGQVDCSALSGARWVVWRSAKSLLWLWRFFVVCLFASTLYNIAGSTVLAPGYDNISAKSPIGLCGLKNISAWLKFVFWLDCRFTQCPLLKDNKLDLQIFKEKKSPGESSEQLSPGLKLSEAKICLGAQWLMQSLFIYHLY